MQYMRLSPAAREELMATLAGMAGYLEEVFGGLAPRQARTPGPNGTFSPVEQVWHLADLEREGFAVRIHRLLTEDAPQLPDFDGARVAAARDYASLALSDGLVAFAQARLRNIEALRRVSFEAWSRKGTQAGVGEVSLCDMPEFMRQHDAAHAAEIDAWKSMPAID